MLPRAKAECCRELRLNLDDLTVLTGESVSNTTFSRGGRHIYYISGLFSSSIVIMGKVVTDRVERVGQ